MSGKKILILNPNGTNIYDDVTLEVAEKAVSSDTNVTVRNLSGSVPKTAFLPATSVLMNQLLTAVVDAGDPCASLISRRDRVGQRGGRQRL